LGCSEVGVRYCESMTAEELVRVVANDRQSSPCDLVAEAARAFVMLGKENENDRAFERSFEESARLLLRGQGHVGPIWRFVNACCLAAGSAEGPEFVVDAVWDAARSYGIRAERASETLTRALLGFIPESSVILTNTTSAGMLSALVTLSRSGRISRLLCCQSAPGKDGEAFAAELYCARVPTEVVYDAMIGPAVGISDLVLIDTDCFSPDNVAAKVGSLPLALVAREAGKRAVIVAESMHLVPRRVSSFLMNQRLDGGEFAAAEAVSWRYARGWFSEDGLAESTTVGILADQLALHPWVARELANAASETKVSVVNEMGMVARPDPVTYRPLP